MSQDINKIVTNQASKLDEKTISEIRSQSISAKRGGGSGPYNPGPPRPPLRMIAFEDQIIKH